MPPEPIRRVLRCTLALATLGAPILAQGASETRIENEFKLSVPDALTEPVREYLRGRYAGDDSILRELGSGFEGRISDEHFVDRYLDTSDLTLLGAESGVRRRKRVNLGDASGDRKHGRELLQLKINRPTDDNPLNRTEVKFEVDPPARYEDPLDKHPLLGWVKRKDRQELFRALREIGVDAYDMRPTITIEQRRWRVYISRGGVAFATLTLDEVESRWYAWKVAFVEIEIELNEIAYTEATPRVRDEMEAISHRLAEDLRSEFPAIGQDQTPKYNKVFDEFSDRIPGFAFLVVRREQLDDFLLLAGVLGLVIAVPGVRGLRRRRSARRRPARPTTPADRLTVPS